MKAATLTIKRMKLSDLKPHERNPRSHPEKDSPEWNVLKSSLANLYFDPVVFNRKNGRLVSGHLRVKVMRDMGYTHADCVVVSLAEPDHIARMIAANKSIGEDDDAALKDLLLELDSANADMTLTGYTLPEIEDMMTAAPPEGAKDDDAEDGGDGKAKRVTCPKCGEAFEP